MFNEMNSSAPSFRKIYSAEQVQLYYERIQLPQKLRNKNVSSIAKTQEGLSFLTTLQKHHLASILFENLDLHYSSHHAIALDPEHVFQKIVERCAGRGGYCMETTGLLATVLRSLKFDIVTAGARVNEAVRQVAARTEWQGPRYNGWNHMIILVTIEGTKYLVDVGMGTTGSVFPVPLVHDQVSSNIEPQQIRLVYEPIPDATDSSLKWWVYQHRHAAELPWIPTYCFQETEFLPNDYMVMNHFTSTHRSSFFTYRVICTKFIIQNEAIVGLVILVNGDVKKRIKGKSSTLANLKTEEERIEALEKYFGGEAHHY